MSGLLIAVGGFLGAISRFALSKWLQKKISSNFPLGTLFVNLLGSFLLGLIVGTGLSSNLYDFLGIGFMGAFTTFSTFKLENIQLREKRKNSILLYYLFSSYVGGIILAFFGILIGNH
ncbi:fluoride efflux transporter CrcB [Bacillus altitudinis]|uniref:fluoride efflux transporter CrcB n=1 Tax=Bacillus TaxID=1386 RepID=UPI000934C460|nr:fluoride efflux transporter CrcB [Bacillus altitudinis]OJT61128.1 chromosome condensation protein CrcB [Bacillus altitudinis]QII24769.1 fluoride efflux transporter CrcB [Bacillus altitudinis]TYS26805.1 fluoride efflux transporter CrcB [Bacillus altitudinis]